MIEIALTVVILGLIGLIGWFDYNNRKERKSLYNLIKAKDVVDLVNLEMADKTQVKIGKVSPPDMIPSDQMSDDEFKKSIEEELKEEEKVV